MKKLLIALCLCSLVLACSLDNTMYNARNYFKAAKARPLNANGRPTPQAITEYTKAIEKCGIILTDRPKSKDADDALFLMSRALYYKGNSAFQAKEQFENLIRVFPDSPNVPESHIYLARVNREIDRAKEAEALLEAFVRDQKYKKHHPRALLVLADFEIQDKDYYRAQYWLEKLLTEYPNTPEYNEAFFL
ncbi:MAG: tetratricopeptide repeat protein, partial [Candidatus Cloacimonadaceae bacterium]|nr:tetratricopeptide repeat protein [Candidatus Cloacimonadaceae bacterium]